MSSSVQTKLVAFHGKQEIKDKYLERLRQHRAADEIIQGTGWEGGKGCAVGCTLHQYNHAAYEIELGIPRILARLEDRLFEGMPNANAKDFPLQFLSAIPVGADLSKVWPRFAIALLIDEKIGVLKFAKSEKVQASIKAVAAVYERSLTEEISVKTWREVKAEAWKVYRAAYAYAAADAAAAAAYAYAYDAAAAAAAAYAYAAADAAAADAAAAAAAAYAYAAADAAAADAAADAAAADAAAADAAAAAAAAVPADRAIARSAARSQQYIDMASKLVELLKSS